MELITRELSEDLARCDMPDDMTGALAWAKLKCFDVESGARRGPEAMREEANAIFDALDPKPLTWRGCFRGWNRSVEVCEQQTLRDLLAKAPKGTTPVVWASFWSRLDGPGDSGEMDVHKAVEEGFNTWTRQLGHAHPRDVTRDSYAFVSVLAGGEMSYVDAGHGVDGLEGFVIAKIKELAGASDGTVVYPGGDAYKAGCREPDGRSKMTRLVKAHIEKKYPQATDQDRKDLIRLLHWNGRRAFVVLCVAFLTRDEMDAARMKHESIKAANREAGSTKRAESKKRKAKRAAAEAEAPAEGTGAKPRRPRLSDVTNVGGDGANATPMARG